MDPRSLANLDPKLRETYERVMGTTTNSGTNTTAAPQSSFYTSASPADTSSSQTPSAPTTATPSQTVEPQAELSPPLEQQASVLPGQGTNTVPQQPIQSFSAPMAEPQAAPTQTINPYANPLPSPASVAAQSKEVSPLLRILYIIGAVIFFAAYTFFWIRVFNLQLPF